VLLDEVPPGSASAGRKAAGPPAGGVAVIHCTLCGRAATEAAAGASAAASASSGGAGGRAGGARTCLQSTPSAMKYLSRLRCCWEKASCGHGGPLAVSAGQRPLRRRAGQLGAPRAPRR
jgi:hypothetical protein